MAKPAPSEDSGPGDSRPAISADEVLRQAVATAMELLRDGQHALAYPLLLNVIDEHERPGVQPTMTIFAAHRMLGQCTRQMRRFDAARHHYKQAFGIAAELRHLDAASGALEGLALVESADDNPVAAVGYFEKSVEYAQAHGPGSGLAHALQNYARFLHAEGDDRAADLYREALAQPNLEPFDRAIITDNFGLELARQGDAAAAIEHCRVAADEFERLGCDYDAFKAYENLAVVGRGHDAAASAAAFRRAHDLIHRVAAEQIDSDHYGTRFRQRVREIEENTWKLFPSDNHRLPPILEIGLLAKMGHDQTEQGEVLLHEGRYAEADQALRQAEASFAELQAHHLLPRVWSSLGFLYMSTGDLERAWDMLQRARMQAHVLGNAITEQGALTNLASLLSRGQHAEFSQLEYVARARALADLIDAPIRNHLAAQGRPADDFQSDAGVLDSIAFGLCAEAGADELAQRYLRRSIAAVQVAVDADSPAAPDASAAPSASDDSGSRSADGADPKDAATDKAMWVHLLARRLSRLIIHLCERDPTHPELPELVTRLTALRASTDSPSLTLFIENALSALAGARDERSTETFAHLRATCDAYEELRRIAGWALGPEGLQDSIIPPYDAAISLAVELNRAPEAFALLERSKARMLLDSIRTVTHDVGDDPVRAREADLWQRVSQMRAEIRRTPDVSRSQDTRSRTQRLWEISQEIGPLEAQIAEVWEQLAQDNRALVAHRRAEPMDADEVLAALTQEDGAALVEFFAGRSLYLFRFVKGRFDCIELLGPNETAGYFEMLEILADHADDAWDRLLTHRTYLKLVQALDDAVGDGRFYVVPHDALHRAPLHLSADGRPRTGTVLLPSASLLRTARLQRRSTRGRGAVVGGDPTLDLTFARVECAIAATRLGTTAVTGTDVTFEWLAATLSAANRPRLVHLACHGYFDERRPERSGLLLAGAEQTAQLVTLAQLASLDWSGVLTVLSACNSGRHEVKPGDELAGLTQTLLAAGAPALLTTLRPVPDLSTALLMSWFYEELNLETAWRLGNVSGALAAAQHRMRTSTATDLVQWATAVAPGGAAETLLATKIVARAHQAAGEMDRYLFWEQRAFDLQQAGGAGEPDALRSEAGRCTDERYRRRPFAAPRHWAAFAVHGAG
ncbi:CHAT domain-containing protein [Micromonospora sp. WMMC415]|uniref:CHAT domain-containing protein n=1 Tax=Micromonospora sp. WMMC415 TaxID=2675222 RepID=UPI0012B4D949|nr:CHAT domain-containing protein [Micromonospora sp. WMMC415]QGN49827.1 CHAT domain-containing protein [Micromonospora sp. WMMC415]